MQPSIPITYVPARNTIMLAFALAWAEQLEARRIYIGVKALDYSGCPDCRAQCTAAFERLANHATKAGVEGRARRIEAALILCTTAPIIRQGLDWGVDCSLTTSCYAPAPDGAACGACDACLLRLRGFAECGVPELARYQQPPNTSSFEEGSP